MSTGLVLSGAGIRGAAHIGAIKALEDASYIAHTYSVTSGDAIVRVIICGWYPLEEIIDFFKGTPIF